VRLGAAVILPLLAARALGAQTAVVYGSARNAATGVAVANVSVFVPGTALKTTSGTNGRYVLRGVPAGQVELRAVVVGYPPAVRTVLLAAGDSVEIDFDLLGVVAAVDDLQAFTTEPLIVTAAKHSQLLAQAVTSVAVVSDSDLARRAVSTVDEAVNRVPGVQFLSGQVNIRGSSGFVEGLGSRVLLLVDGVPANEGDRGGIDWDMVPLADVQRVEVVKGAGSSLYGSAAFGGVVNLITQDIPVGFHGRARVTAGLYANPPSDVWKFRDASGGLGGLDLTGSYGTEALRGALTLGGRHSDGYREQDASNQWETSGRAEWRPAPGTRVTAAGAWTSHQYEVFPTWCGADQCDTRGQAFQPFMIDPSGRGSYTRSNKGYLFATLDRTDSPRFGWLARGSWLRSHFTDYNPDDWSVSDRLGAELRGVARAGGGADRVLTFGAEGAHTHVTSDIFGSHGLVASHDEVDLAAYGEGEQRVGRVRLTAGARLDGVTVDGVSQPLQASPQLGAVLPTSLGTWRASVGRGFRAATIAERFVTTQAFGFQVIPNPSLRPETAWSFELGDLTTVSSWVRLDAALFWTETRQLIEPAFVVDSSGAKIQIQNVSRARLRGLDASLAMTPIPALTGSIAYLLLDARDLATDSVLAFRPKHLLTLSADYRWRAVSVGGDFRYSSRIERIELEAVFGHDPRVSAKVLDVRAGWQRGGLSARVLVANALNYIYNLVPRTLEPVRTASVVLTWTY
jgi:outer membrane receptor for ferrienterochelin and colicins